MKRKIIVNADDLGAESRTNDAIFVFIQQGRVTSATILANGPAVEDAVKRTRDFPEVSFGVHLNASEYMPVTPSPGLAPILDAEGCFAGNRLREVAIGGQLRRALLVEWSAQIQKLRELGVHVSHIDSHHHMHTVPGVFPVIKSLQHRFGIKKVRASMNLYSRAHAPGSRSLLLKKLLWNAGLRHLVATTTTDGFTSLEMFVQAVLETEVPFKTIELMVHPGNVGFSDETRILAGPWEKSLPFPVEFIGYSDL